jgi:hypothetical protein
MTQHDDPSRVLLRFSAALTCGLMAVFGAGCGADVTGSNASGMGGGGGMGAGTGGSGTSGPECDAAFGPTDPTALIDDMEDGDPSIAQVLDRNGSWWVTGDPTPGGTVTPPSGAAPPPERILGGRCDSRRAIRVTGQGFKEWGAVVSVGMGYDTQSTPTDASSFQGVMFWARVGETNNSKVRVQFQDVHTFPEGGLCKPERGAPDESYNGFGTELVPIDTKWRLYKLPFARMTQRDFGYRADSLDPSQIYNIDWNLDADSVFDLWVDDVWFYE